MRHVLFTGAALAMALAAAGCATTPETESTMTPEAAAPVAPAEPAAPVQAALPAPTNVLLRQWSGPHGGVPPWNIVRADLFGGAFQEGIERQRAEIQAIVNNPAPATFENTFVALENAGRDLDRAQTLFGVMTNNLNTPDIQAVDTEWSPKLQAAFDEITFNDALFRRVEAVYNNRASLTPEQQRLVERSYRSYVRNGAKLTPEQKAQLGQINQQLSSLFTDFGQKVLADENTWVVLDSRADLAGLPESVVASAAAAANERKLPGKWVIVNTRSSVDPFLTFSTRRDLREKVWRAFVNRGDNGGATDTNQVIAQIVKLRADRAKLLGFPTHAHWRMDDTMAKDPQKAMELMLRVWQPAAQRVKEEVADMQAIANREARRRADRITIEPWDYRFYAEKVRKAKYDLDQNEIKPYFELNNMIEASYWTANQLYGLSFKEITGTVPTFHPDVRVYEVSDRDGSYLGLLYRDDFARPGKRSGAWQSTYRGHETFTGSEVTPIASNNNNFVKGAAGQPVLISLDDAETLFHEFGHAIHALVSEVNYPSLGNTPRDYVEFPSQVLENWVLTRPVLDRFMKHYQTGQPMPQALVDKIQASQKFNQGFATVEYLGSALVDMAIHAQPGGVVDPDSFERETLARIGMPKEIVMRHRLPQFNHLFTSDAYSAGYYSYLWSDTMAADAWAAFEENGNPFDPTLSAGMRNYILAPGNSYDRAEAFRRFRGRDPNVNALLQSRGFPVSGGTGSGGTR